jgi:hypothetical protein
MSKRPRARRIVVLETVKILFEAVIERVVRRCPRRLRVGPALAHLEEAYLAEAAILVCTYGFEGRRGDIGERYEWCG